MAQSMDSMDETAEPSGSTPESIIPGFTDVNEYSQHALKSVLQATRASNDLPTGDDFDFYSTYRSVREILDIEGRRILHLLQNVMRQQNTRVKFSTSSDAIDLEDKFDAIMDANDQILERVGSSLDEAAGIRKPEAELVVATTVTKTATAASWNKKKQTQSPSSTFRLLSARNIQRPQLKFKDKIDNSNRPFLPTIKHKPNAQQSLEDSLKLPEDITVEDLDGPAFVYPHPYVYELDHLNQGNEWLEEGKLQEPLPLADTPLTMVDTEAGLEAMCKHLTTVKEIAVDLEAHTYRSFQGITCLMQISTRKRDYIVDTLAVRHHIHILNEVFTNPDILKVFHGADMDIGWLQRDFSVYVVNMFDTGQAARVLQHSRFSLAHLLKIYCQVDADKQFQLADWRIRPLPEELVKYAREDTHYLLYIYDKMKSELIQQGNKQNNLLLSVITRSTRLCSQVYRKPMFSESHYLELYHKSKKIFNSQQLQALREIYAWRNKIARIEDESIGYVLPNHMLLQMSEILPREKQGVLACCNPIPPLVRQNLSEIHGIILQAREVPLVKMEHLKQVQPSRKQHPKYDSNSLLNCPHDLSHQAASKQESNSQLDSSLISSSSSMFGEIKVLLPLKTKPIISAFFWPNERHDVVLTAAQKKSEEIRKSFLSPFEMYLPADKAEAKGVKADKAEKNINRWKLKPNSAVVREGKHKVEEETDPITGQPVHVYEPPAKKKKVDTVTNPTITQEEMDTEILLNKDMPRKKKKKRKEEPLYEAELPEHVKAGPVKGNFLGAEMEGEEQEEAGGQSLVEGKKKKKKKKFKMAEQGFEPYDYSKADKSILQGSSSKEGNPGKRFKKGKRDKKQKHLKSRGNKSVTFH